MPRYFYFNDLMPSEALADINIQEVFEQTMMNYVRLRKEKILDIGLYIVIGDDIDKIYLGGVLLTEMIFKIKDRELKKACISYFRNSYPINDIKVCSIDNFDDSTIEEISDLVYSNGKSSTNVAIASLHAKTLLSLPISDEWKKTDVVIDEKGKYHIVNFYGDNRYSVIDKFLTDDNSASANKLRFIHRLDKYNIEFCKDFGVMFESLKAQEQKHRCDRLYIAYQKKLIDLNIEDENLYRQCKCTGSDNMFELKSSYDMGLRFYLMKCPDSVLIFGGHSFKSKVKGEKQDHDMIRAFDTIKKYLKK